MNRQSVYDKITKELQRLLSVSDLYDFDRNKEQIHMVVMPVKSNRALLEELPHLLFYSTDYAGVFSLELFQSTDFSISHYITHAHLHLWQKTVDDLYRLVTGSNLCSDF